ncbi:MULTISPECIES: LysR substrate-binding domain-containing protein [Pseudoalteromonas]|uniref:LysR substrate-binding domain-containing protein n=1 Tax=Pseudoalteromonas TaxID=53246 RepID=UPI0006D681E0|nr:MULTISPECIES: LysR substrate-binding domain-containing protein [Pseudoalteromonas]KPZ67200.1 HTH-type transcriptional activator CmpR [Pseudoalteromonas sp. P1-26]MDK9685759.1 LysR substrate-binding domain-containing protein [Pseudoalteromonas shioyasakiensis]
MNLHALRVFYTVAKLQSFSGAAETLFISQPAVSKALKELEHQLSLKLIERATKGRKLALTEGGVALYEHARNIFAIEKTAIDDIKSRTGLKRGTIVIGTSTTIASYWLPPYLARFCSAYPNIKVEVKVENTEKIEHALLECSIDLALVEGTPAEKKIVPTHWQDDLMSVVIPPHFKPSHNLNEWLSQQFWLLREPGSGTREMSVKMLEKQGIKVSNSMQLGSNEAIARSVAQGMGIAILPNVVTEDLVQLKKLKRLSQVKGGMLSRPLYQLQCRGRSSSHSAEALKRILFSEV